MSTTDENSTRKYIPFEDVVIETTITKDLNIITKWIAEVEKDYLEEKKLNIGLDTEWTPLAEAENPIGILQLCVELKCLIFPVNNAYDIPGPLITFLNNPKYTFTGVEIKKDVEKLAYKNAFVENNMKELGKNFVDLRELAVEKQYFDNKEGVGLISLAKKVLDIAVEKDEHARMSTWHTDLTPDQEKYASIDAYLSFKIGKDMLELE